MLNSYEHGYAVMTRKLDAYSLEDTSLETCKRYCYNDDMVVVEKIPYVCGFNIRIRYVKTKYREFFCYDKYANLLRIGKLSIQILREYDHKNGKIVYDPKKDKQ